MITAYHIHMPTTTPDCSTAQGIITTVGPIIVFHKVNTVESELWPFIAESDCESSIIVGKK